MRSRTIATIAATVTWALTGACSRPNEAAGDLAPEGVIGLQVQNDNFLDIDVFAVTGGQPARLGMVTGHTARSFALRPGMAVRDLRIVATPIGGRGQASTGSVVVAPGQTIVFTVGSTLGNSTV